MRSNDESKFDRDYTKFIPATKCYQIIFYSPKDLFSLGFTLIKSTHLLYRTAAVAKMLIYNKEV